MRNLDGLVRVQPGEVKNPKGRPKGSPNRGAQIKRILSLKSEELNPITKAKERLTQEQWCIIGMIGAARRGNTRAFEILMDGKYGPILKLLNGGNDFNESDRPTGESFTSFEVIDPSFNESIELEIGAGQ